LPRPGLMQTLYGNRFHHAHRVASLASTAVGLPLLFAFYRPKSVIKIGYRLDTWLKISDDSGINDILGPRSFRAVKLARPRTLERPLDLATWLESGEHPLFNLVFHG
jgi:hypothetical protein